MHSLFHTARPFALLIPALCTATAKRAPNSAANKRHVWGTSQSGRQNCQLQRQPETTNSFAAQPNQPACHHRQLARCLCHAYNPSQLAKHEGTAGFVQLVARTGRKKVNCQNSSRRATRPHTHSDTVRKYCFIPGSWVLASTSATKANKKGGLPGKLECARRGRMPQAGLTCPAQHQLAAILHQAVSMAWKQGCNAVSLRLATIKRKTPPLVTLPWRYLACSPGLRTCLRCCCDRRILWLGYALVSTVAATAGFDAWAAKLRSVHSGCLYTALQ